MHLCAHALNSANPRTHACTPVLSVCPRLAEDDLASLERQEGSIKIHLITEEEWVDDEVRHVLYSPSPP